LRIKTFNREQQDLVGKLLQLIKPFKRDANSTAHKVNDYLTTLDELDKLRIPMIIELELQLLRKIMNANRESV
jgi:hypothetical protein